MKLNDMKRWAEIHKEFSDIAGIDLKKPTDDDFKRFKRLSAWVSYFTNSRERLPLREDFLKIQYALGA